MRLQLVSAFIVLVIGCASMVSAQAPPPCTNADKIGCTHHPTYGWISGSAPINPSSSSPQASPAQAAEQARREQSEYADRIERMEAERQARTAAEARAAELVAGGFAGETRSQAFRRFHAACIQSNWRIGCGAAAEIVYENPEYFCEMLWEHDRYTRCTPARERAATMAYDGCIKGDAYACDVQQRIRSAAGAPTLAPSSYGKAAPPPAPRSAAAGTPPAAAMPVEEDSAYRASMSVLGTAGDPYSRYKKGRQMCLDRTDGIGCGATAQLVLDYPEFECRYRQESNGSYCEKSLDHAGYWSGIGCARGDRYSCTVEQKVKALKKQAAIDLASAIPVVDEGAYKAFKVPAQNCLSYRSSKHCLTAAKMTLDDPKLSCRFLIDGGAKPSCVTQSAVSAAKLYASAGCSSSKQGDKDNDEACALRQDLDERERKAGGT